MKACLAEIPRRCPICRIHDPNPPYTLYFDTDDVPSRSYSLISPTGIAIATLSTEIADLEETNADLKETNAGLEGMNASLEDRCANLEEENADLRRKNADLEKKTQDLDISKAKKEREGSSTLKHASYLSPLKSPLCLDRDRLEYLVERLTELNTVVNRSQLELDEEISKRKNIEEKALVLEEEMRTQKLRALIFSRQCETVRNGIVLLSALK